MRAGLQYRWVAYFRCRSTVYFTHISWGNDQRLCEAGYKQVTRLEERTQIQVQVHVGQRYECIGGI